MSMIVGTCSIPTGHASTHAMQVVHDHRTSSGDQRLGAVAVRCSSRVLVQAIADVEDQLPRRQGRAGGGGRADGRAAAALGARERVEHLLPAQVGQRGDADEALRWSVEGGHRGRRHVRDRQRPLRAARRELPEEHVGDRGDDVEVLGQRQQAQEDQDRRAVQPPSDLADGLRRRAAQAAERGGHQPRHRREVPLVAVDVVRDQAAGVVQQPADHDEQDEEEDHDALPVRGVADSAARRGAWRTGAGCGRSAAGRACRRRRRSR